MWNGGSTKFMRLTVTNNDSSVKSINILIHDGKVYGNVTWQCEGVNSIGKLTTSAIAKLVVKDSNGKVVFGA